MVGFGLALSLLFVPDIKKTDENGQHEVNIIERNNMGSLSALEILSKFNPSGIFRPLMYSNVLFAVGMPYFETVIVPLILQEPFTGFDLWLSGLLSVCASYLSPLYNQPSFSPHDTSC